MAFVMNWNLRNKYLLAGVGAYLLFLLVTLPASLLSARLARHGIQTSSTSGSIWHGEVTGLQAGVLNLGNAEWRIRFLPLLTGKLAADVKLTQANGHAQTRISTGWSGRITLSDVSASLPLQSLVGNSGLPGGWVGTAQARFKELVLDHAWPVAAQGTLDLLDLTGPSRQPSNIGAYRLQFPTANASENALTGDLQSLNGAALDVVGTLKFASDRSYQLDAMVAARGNAPPDLAQSMQMLGTPDAQGRRPFSVAGTL